MFDIYEEERVGADRPILEVDDIMVLLLGAPAPSPSMQDQIEGVTRLEKLVFLLEKESGVAELMTERADFKSDNFGPFSAKIYQAAETLSAAGLVEDSGSISPSTEDTWESSQIIGTDPSDPYATRNFQLTDRGRRYYLVLLKELPPETDRLLAKFKERYAALPLRQLIRYVYKRYPEFTDKSLIREQVLGE